MKAIFLSLFLIVGPSLLAVLILANNEIRNRIGGGKIVVKTFLSSAWVIFGILSLVQTILGEKTFTLQESVSRLTTKRYVMYFVACYLIVSVYGIVLKSILKERYNVWLNKLVTYGIISLCALYILEGKYINVTVAVIFLFGFILLFLKKKDEEELIDYRGRLQYALPISLLYVILMILYLPFELYIGNMSEFKVELGIVLASLIIHSIIIMILFLMGILFFNTSVFNLFYTGLFAITCCGYFQNMFFNGQLGAMDGSVQSWNMKEKVVNAIIWITIICIIYFVNYKWKEKSYKIFTGVCIYICLIQLVSSITLFLTTENKTIREDVLTYEGLLELHEEDNVLVFVLDFFDTQILDQMYEEDKEFFSILKDFTYYPNTTSKYAFTASSVPYLLTGVEAKEVKQISDETYWEYAYNRSDFLPTIAEKGYSIDVYTEVHYIGDNVKSLINNCTSKEEKDYFLFGIMNTFCKTSKYKTSPFFLKSKYWYASNEMNKLVRINNEYDTMNDLAIYEKLTEDGLRIDPDLDKGAFKLYHMYGAHLPFNMNENLERVNPNIVNDARAEMISQAKGCLKIVYEYIEQLKKIGVYDTSTIIITADHGQNFLAEEDRIREAERLEFEQISSPILFLKQANQENENEMEISLAPTSHSDLHATIIDVVGAEADEFGRKITDIKEDEIRDRIFMYGRRGMSYREYLIQGDVRDINSWSLQKEYQDK